MTPYDTAKPHRVLVVQRRMTHYRLALFEALCIELRRVGCELVLAYGDPTLTESDKNDGADIAWARRLPTKYFFGGRVCWQPFGHLLRDVTMVVLTTENKLVNNLPVQFLNRRVRVALWGHGGNLRGDPNSWRERFKRRVGRQADWWFGYTKLSAPLIERTGFAHNRITILNNTIDTKSLAAQMGQLSSGDLAALRAKLGLREGCVGVYLGSLYQGKRIDFLLEAAAAVRSRVPDFSLLIAGGGPHRHLVDAFCRQHAWAHYLGVLKDANKAAVLGVADVVLNPGAVGLVILDAFVGRVPLVTIDGGCHGPEIAYLEHGVNGLMTRDSLQAYADGVVDLLAQPNTLSRLREGCALSAKCYTVEQMARNFAQGVAACLEQPLYRGHS